MHHIPNKQTKTTLFHSLKIITHAIWGLCSALRGRLSIARLSIAPFRKQMTQTRAEMRSHGPRSSAPVTDVRDVSASFSSIDHASGRSCGPSFRQAAAYGRFNIVEIEHSEAEAFLWKKKTNPDHNLSRWRRTSEELLLVFCWTCGEDPQE